MKIWKYIDDKLFVHEGFTMMIYGNQIIFREWSKYHGKDLVPRGWLI